MEKVLNLTFASSLDGLCELNSSFDTGKLRIAYTGENRNRTSIDKSVFEKATKSLHGVPVVCNYNVQTDSIGGHDMGVVTNDNGEMRLINLTEPVGFVPESANSWFENITEEDGSVHEYLCADVLLWKRQAAYKHIKENGVTAHSMEITVKSGEKIDDIYNIYDFEFTALCLLGDVEPCFESSALETYSAKNFSVAIEEMMAEAKKVFSTIVTTDVDNDTLHPQKISEEGGEIVLEDNNVFTVENNEEQTVEEEKFDNENIAVDNEAENIEPSAEAQEESTPAEENFELNSNIVDGMYSAIGAEQFVDRWGDSRSKYFYIDHDSDQGLVYACDRSDWNIYGFSYSLNNDDVVVDFGTKRRMKWAIVEYTGAEQSSILSPIFSEYEKKIDEGCEFAAKFSEAEKTIESLTAEVDELRAFKAMVEKNDNDQKRSNLFSMFEDLNGIEAFELLKENNDISIEDLEEKCFAIRGRNASQTKFSLENKSTIIKVDQPEETANAPYGGVVEKYLGKIG